MDARSGFLFSTPRKQLELYKQKTAFSYDFHPRGRATSACELGSDRLAPGKRQTGHVELASTSEGLRLVDPALKWSSCLSLARGELGRGGVDFGTVGKAGVPTAPALRGEIHEVPDRTEQINATLLNVGRHPRMPCVKVTQRTIGVARENGNG
jgi:hypothetical protein